MSKAKLCGLVLLFAAAVPLCSQSDELPRAQIQASVTTACTECHESRIIVQQRLNKAGWTKEVDKMMKWGALVDPKDRDAFIDYLSTNFPPNKQPYVAAKTTPQKPK